MGKEEDISRVGPPETCRSRHPIVPPQWHALIIAGFACMGVLALLTIRARLGHMPERDFGGALMAALGFALVGGGLGMWSLFRTRHPLVILASLAAIAALLLEWFYLIEPALKP